jgi:histone acetyltransferase (RNA polymerase elongator complex component)
MPENAEINIAFFGGSFTGLPLSLQEEYLAAAYPYIRSGRVSGIRLSTRPDYINEEILNLLKKYRTATIELGAQSFDNEVLRLSQRGHTAETIDKASQMILRKGFKLGLQMMIGLPGDTNEKAINTAHRIISAGAHETRIYPTLVIKNTRLAHWYNKGKYQALTLNRAVMLSEQLLGIFETAGVKVLRMGLHPSEELAADKSLIAGPYHPSFKELVLSRRWRNLLLQQINNKPSGTELKINPREINYAVGYNSSNREYFKKMGIDLKLNNKEGVLTLKPELP